ncbi:hypothetical protein FACS189413_17280 [Bacteroidia bacterium]|nr:hypothetical protein FACS189413_17280 [Bacteroidia bacterium]
MDAQLVLSIPENKKVVWKAQYGYAICGGTNNTLTVSGGLGCKRRGTRHFLYQRHEQRLHTGADYGNRH